MLYGLGRVTETQLNSDPAGADDVNTSYDSLGRVASVTNPSRTTSTGGDTYSYDALGRVTSVTHADSNATLLYYGPGVATYGRTTPMCSNGPGYPELDRD
ncbi:MAG: RHS repeat domain-containing protein, partial [Terriglobia bacterium]